MLPGKSFTGPRYDRPSPSMLLAFALDGALDSRVTYTRASSGTRFDYNAVMQTETTNAARFTHDPATYYPSSTSNSISRGRKTFAVSYQYTVGAIVQATYDASNWVRGTVIAASGSSVTIRVENTAGSGTYAAWNLIQCLGLLIEESRTNLLTYSEEFDNAAWSKFRLNIAGGFPSPDGGNNAFHIVETAETGQHFLRRLVSMTAGSVYTFYVFAKAAEISSLTLGSSGANWSAGQTTFNLSSGVIASGAGIIKAVGAGWFFCSISGVAIATSSSAGPEITTSSTTGDGTSGIYIWGAQLEAGSFPTSYIKTTSSAATRAADNASITGANFSSWYNQTEGAFVFSGANIGGTVSFPIPLIASDGTDSNRVQFYLNKSTGRYSAFMVSGGVSQADVSPSGAPAQTVEFSIAASFKTNSTQCSLDGAVGTEDTSCAMPSGINQLGIGNRSYSTTQAWSGTIASIAYYPKALPGYLQHLTS